MIKAEIVAHSLSPQGDELISVLCTFPRIILAEVNTHRMLSKNTSSSRAIKFKKMNASTDIKSLLESEKHELVRKSKSIEKTIKELEKTINTL